MDKLTLSTLFASSGKIVNVKMQTNYMTFKDGESTKEIPYSDLGLTNKQIYGLFSSANSAEGDIMPELQIYNTPTGIRGSLHLGSEKYAATTGCGFHILIFHE